MGEKERSCEKTAGSKGKREERNPRPGQE